MTVLRRTYSITQWIRWDDEVDAAVRAFRAEFGVAPLILLASSASLARIDLAAKKDRLVDGNGARPHPDQYAAVGSFSGADYLLEFCVDERLPTSRISLVFDSDPGDGEPLPEEDSPLPGQWQRSA
jgi:hypothetical protein